MSRPKGRKWTELNAAELAAATREYDRAETTPKGRPLTRAERAKLKHLLSDLRDERHERVVVSIEPQLLKQADRRAELLNLSRSELIQEALKQILRPSA